MLHKKRQMFMLDFSFRNSWRNWRRTGPTYHQRGRPTWTRVSNTNKYLGNRGDSTRRQTDWSPAVMWLWVSEYHYIAWSTNWITVNNEMKRFVGGYVYNRHEGRGIAHRYLTPTGYMRKHPQPILVERLGKACEIVKIRTRHPESTSQRHGHLCHFA
jgi:hypothetical protein